MTYMPTLPKSQSQFYTLATSESNTGCLNGQFCLQTHSITLQSQCLHLDFLAKDLYLTLQNGHFHLEERDFAIPFPEQPLKPTNFIPELFSVS